MNLCCFFCICTCTVPCCFLYCFCVLFSVNMCSYYFVRYHRRPALMGLRLLWQPAIAVIVTQSWWLCCCFFWQINSLSLSLSLCAVNFKALLSKHLSKLLYLLVKDPMISSLQKYELLPIWFYSKNQEAQLSPRDLSDALCQLKYCQLLYE